MQIQIDTSSSLTFILNLVKRKQYLEALDRYKDYLIKTPDHLALILTDLYKILYNHPNEINIRLIITELYIKHEFYTDACIELEEMIDIDPDFSQSYFLLSKVYAQKAEEKTICALFEGAFESGIRDAVILDFLPKIYLDFNEPYKAISIYETLLAEKDSLPHRNKTLAELYKRVGKYEKCVSIYLDLIALDPQFLNDGCILFESILTLQPALNFVRLELIHFYIAHYDPDKAITHVTYLCKDNDFSLEKSKPLFAKLLSIFPSHLPSMKLYCERLICEEAITESIPLLTELETHQQDTFIETSITHINESFPNHYGFNLFLINRSINQQNYSLALDIISNLIQMRSNNDIFEDLKSYCLKIWEKAQKEHKITASYTLALILFYEDKFIDSLNYCNECGDTHLEAICLKISILNKQENFTEAKKLCIQHINDHKNYKPLHDLMYQIHQQTTKLRHAQTSLSVFHPILSDLSLGNFHETIDAIQAITPKNDDYSLAQLLLIRSFYIEQKFEQALTISSQLANHLSELKSEYIIDSLFLKSICLYSLGEFEKVEDTLNIIESINISHSYTKYFKEHLYHLPLSKHKGSALSGLINVWNDGIHHLMIQNTEESTINSQSNTTISFGLNHNDKGCQYMLKKNITSAFSEFNLSLQLDPSLTIAHCNYALYQLETKHYDDALNSLEMAKKLTNSLDIIFLNEGLIYYKKQDYHHALLSFQEALRINPKNIHVQFNLAMIYFLKNNIELCFNYLKKLTPYGCLFMYIHNFFHYLEKDPFILSHWICPSENYDISPLNY